MKRYFVEYDDSWGFNGTYWVWDSSIEDGEPNNIMGYSTREKAQAEADRLNAISANQ